ncbi:ArnT family glycosyltransferase [Erythrobacter sp. GH1-10]|uniref:ArnT family glycosyltransferase n=1 Tax=Erythrobacter sp. GH1-10 TaxID=3349334 RepID=UPI00387808A8
MSAVEDKPSVDPKGAVLGYALLGMVLLGLAGRLLAYPHNRDENMFVSVASQVGNGDLYRDLGYNHLPNLAYLMAGVFSLTGTDHFLFVARLVVFSGWIAAILGLWLIVRRLRLGVEVFFAAAALILGNVLLLGPSGMLASNNFLPIPLVFFAFYFLLGALDDEMPRSGSAFLAGVLVSLTIGMKANFVIVAPLFALATLFSPQQRSWRERIMRSFVPLAIGGVIGGAPVLVHLALDPQGFLAHTLRYFTELQTAYWRDADVPQTVNPAEKVLLAELIWFRGTFMLAIAASAILTAKILLKSSWRSLLDWRLIVLSSLLIGGGVVAFVPTPSFPQYFVPPIPFLVLLFVVLADVAREDGRNAILPIMVAVALLGVLTGASRIVPGLMEFRKTSAWETLALKREVMKTADEAGLARGARVATLTPVFALEGGFSIYPEFAAGQFVFRVAPYISEADRVYYRTTSPTGLEAFLDADQPDGILVNRAEPIERALADYARSRGYETYTNTSVAQGFDLYVPARNIRSP